MRWSPLQKFSVSIGAALFVIGLFAAMAFYYSSRLVAADHAVERTNAAISSAIRVVTSRQDGERAAKAYVVRGDSAARMLLHDAQSRVEESLEHLTRSSEDNPRQRKNVLVFGRRVAADFEAFRTTLRIRDVAGADSARRYLSSDLRTSAGEAIVKLADIIRNEELRVLAETVRQQSENSAKAQRVILYGMVFTFLLAGVALQPMRTQVAERITTQLVRDHVAAVPELAADRVDSARETSARLQGLHRLIAELSDAPDAASGARAIVAAARELLPTEFAAVVAPAGSDEFSVLASSHADFTAVSAALAAAVAGPMRTGEAEMAESRAERERRWGALDSLDDAGARGAVLLVPLSREGAVNGVLIAAVANDTVFGDDLLTCAATLGRLGAAAVSTRSLTS